MKLLFMSLICTKILQPIRHETFGIYLTESLINVYLLTLHNRFNMITSATITTASVFLQKIKI